MELIHILALANIINRAIFVIGSQKKQHFSSSFRVLSINLTIILVKIFY